MRNKEIKRGILFTIGDLRPGGAEMFLLRLAQYLSSNFNIYIFCLNPEKNDVDFLKLFHANLNFKFLESNSKTSPFQEKLYWKINALGSIFGLKGLYSKIIRIKNRQFIKKQIKQYNIVAINSSGISSDNRSIFYFKKNFKIPVLITMHSDYNEEFWELKDRKKEDFFKLSHSILSKADSILYTADHNIKIFQKIENYTGPKPEKCYLGFNPAPKKNIRASLNIPENAFVIVMMARGIREKGFVEAIDAFKLLKKEFFSSYLILIATETNHIKTLKEENKTEPNIIFMGYQADPSPILNSSNCMVLPSHFPESLPYTITESLACGKPVLACPIAEIPKMLKTNEGIAGELIPLTKQGIADHIFLAEKLIEYAKNPSLFSEKEKLAALAFQKFDMKKCGEFYLNQFNKIITKDSN